MNEGSNNQPVAKKIVIGQILSESWGLVSGFKWPVFATYFLPLIPLMLLFFLMMAFIPGLIRLFFSGPSVSVFIFIGIVMLALAGLVFLCMWLIMCVLTILGIRRAIGLPPKISVALSQCMRVKKPLFYLFLVWFFIGMIYTLICQFALPHGAIGVILNILLYIVSLYFMLPISIFALPLIVIKQYNVSRALSDAFNKMNKYYVEIIPLNLIILILAAVSAIPLGIGLIWTIPFYYAMTGILFRNLYGLKRK